jgi:hypothetical protein
MVRALPTAWQSVCNWISPRPSVCGSRKSVSMYADMYCWLVSLPTCHRLQGGPGCTSLFGMLYINGPYWVNEDDLTLRPNPGSWNRLYGLLYIEQPIGTGFSHCGRCSLASCTLSCDSCTSSSVCTRSRRLYLLHLPHVRI